MRSDGSSSNPPLDRSPPRVTQWTGKWFWSAMAPNLGAGRQGNSRAEWSAGSGSRRQEEWVRMDDRRFDQLAKTIAGEVGSRREALGLAISGAAAAVFGFLDAEEAADAQRRNNNDRNRRRRNRGRGDRRVRICHCGDNNPDQVNCNSIRVPEKRPIGTWGSTGTTTRANATRAATRVLTSMPHVRPIKGPRAVLEHAASMSAPPALQVGFARRKMPIAAVRINPGGIALQPSLGVAVRTRAAGPMKCAARLFRGQLATAVRQVLHAISRTPAAVELHKLRPRRLSQRA